ncbi:MAG: DUF2029 domain-containing protein [Bacteroidetes bacterium]|nr:MAG: DUF2029 domain-containing protein [Bacteroidota bacterium]
MKEKVQKILSHRTFIVILYVLFAMGASTQSILLSPKTNQEEVIEYTKYNNYVIFSQSYHHLKNNQDLYIAYPDEHWDLFKYTPTFSVFFGFFTLFPDWLGLNLWNLLNALVLLSAVYYLQRINNIQKGWMLLIVLLEFMGSMMGEQSNALIAGLLIFSFGLLENKKLLIASLCIVLTVFIKLFGVVGFALFLFYPQKWKLALYSLGWTLIMLLIPFIYIDYEQYLSLFSSYGNMLTSDPIISNGFSVMGWLNSWFSLNVSSLLVVLTGAGVFLLPLARIRAYKYFSFRYLTLASVLLWIVIFNHKAESPTYIIAMTGVALWFIEGEKSPINIVLLVLALVLTSLSSTDIFPTYLRTDFIQPYAIKAFPCILIWMKIIYDMMLIKTDQNKTQAQLQV